MELVARLDGAGEGPQAVTTDTLFPECDIALLAWRSCATYLI
ncbi:MAG: hypothetical protein QXH42_05695 [Thermoplasmata archaeon]